MQYTSNGDKLFPKNNKGFHKYSGVRELYNSITPSNIKDIEFSSIISDIVTENGLYNQTEEYYTLEKIGQIQTFKKLKKSFPNSFYTNSYNGQKLISLHKDYIMLFDAKIRNDYIELITEYLYHKEEKKKQAENKILKTFEKHILHGTFINVDWVYGSRANTSSIKELIGDSFVNEAYPTIKPNLVSWTNKYLRSHESVLILLGKAGTGKTRLIRHIIKQYDKINNKKTSVLYGANKETLKNEKVFTKFLQDNYNFLILEDVDQALEPRKDGNFSMTNLLTTADGFIQNLNRKIIVSTNLPNIRNIDDALLRSGRCWDKHQFRSHNKKEAQEFLEKMEYGKNLDKLYPEKDSFTLAQLYSLINTGEL